MNTEDKITTNKKIWTDDYHYRLGLKMESVAGYGSSLWNTRILIQELPKIFNKYSIKSILDIPCADFYWMSRVNMTGVYYIGADFIDELITKNKINYPEKDFKLIDMTIDPIPTVDLIFCRDCLVHMSFYQINKVITSFRNSKSKFLMAGTCPEIKKNEELIGIIGWRPLNLQLYPILLSDPLEIISEQTDKNPEKCMAIWKL